MDVKIGLSNVMVEAYQQAQDHVKIKSNLDIQVISSFHLNSLDASPLL